MQNNLSELLVQLQQQENALSMQTQTAEIISQRRDLLIRIGELIAQAKAHSPATREDQAGA